MGKYNFFKIRAENEDNIDLGDTETFDNTSEYILQVHPPQYSETFENLLLTFGSPLNTQDDFDKFITFLTERGIKAYYADYYFISNYNEIKKQRERLKNLKDHLEADAIKKEGQGN